MGEHQELLRDLLAAREAGASEKEVTAILQDAGFDSMGALAREAIPREEAVELFRDLSQAAARDDVSDDDISAVFDDPVLAEAGIVDLDSLDEFAFPTQELKREFIEGKSKPLGVADRLMLEAPFALAGGVGAFARNPALVKAGVKATTRAGTGAVKRGAGAVKRGASKRLGDVPGVGGLLDAIPFVGNRTIGEAALVEGGRRLGLLDFLRR